jgi:uncharacterized protein (TIGR02001 family)
VLRLGGLLFALSIATPACAQVSGSASVFSDYRYHGTSLSDGEPTAQVALAWDRGDGWYAGLQLTRVRFVYPGAGAELQAVPYLGYVHVLASGLGVEAGAQYTWFSDSGTYDYPEFYLGLGGERLRGRVSWLRDYFGQGSAWYAELDGSRPLRGALRAVGHVGVLHQGAGHDYGETSARPWRYDVAAGLGFARAGFDLQATWTTTSGVSDESCVPWQCGARNGWVLRLSRNW